MAEKEERIMIIEVGEQCSYRFPASITYFAKNGDNLGTRQEIVCHREDNWGNQCDDKWCEKCDKKDLVGMKRQDAIERMTVAMCKFDCTDNERACENCNEWEKYDKCESLAEAALNALLEGK